MIKKGIQSLLVLFILSVVLLSACGEDEEEPKTYKIGVVIYVPFHTLCYDGFKAGLTELGYVEDETVAYIYNGIVDSTPEAIDSEIKDLLDQDVDMLFTIGHLATLQAQQAVVDTDIPIIFSMVGNAVGEGFAESFSHPGGNLTGVQAVSTTDKALELMVELIQAEKVYIPYNPDDEASQLARAEIGETAASLGVELVDGKVHSVTEAVTAIESLPEDIDAILRIPSPTLDPENSALSQAAIQRGLPMGAIHSQEDVIFSLGVDLFQAGKDSAQLADQVFEGSKPADLPVWTADITVTIDLQIADAIGLEIPDTFLQRANVVIREEE